MSVFALLAEVVDDRFAPRGYADPCWTVVGSRALLDWDAFGSMRVRPGQRQPGRQDLVLVAPPPFLPLVQALHAQGWRRGGWSDGHLWQLYAYLRRDGSEVRVTGSVDAPGHSGMDGLWPFFSPPPPALSRRKGFVDEYQEWVRRGREDAW